VLDHFRHAAIARGNRDHFTGHTFEGCESEGFQFAWHQQKIRQWKQLVYPFQLAHKMNLGMNAQIVSQPLRRRPIRPIAHHYQLRRHLPNHPGEDFHHVHHPLDRPEIGEVHQDRLLRRSQPLARLRPPSLVLIGPVNVAVDEVPDYLNGPRHIKVLNCFFL